MEIKTKFEVGNLTKRQFDAEDKDSFIVNQVMEVLTQTCYAGTQVFYLCRSVIAKKKYVDEYRKKDSSFHWRMHHSISDDMNKLGWHKYREDELIEAPEGHQAIIKGLLVGKKD